MALLRISITTGIRLPLLVGVERSTMTSHLLATAIV